MKHRRDCATMRVPRAQKPANAATPSPAPADKSRSTEIIAQDLAIAIVEKRLPPGAWLSEEALCRVYAVRRTEVRSALLLLSKDKLIEISPDKEAFVCRPSVQEAREVFAVRRILEGEVVRLFIPHAQPQDYDALEQHIRFERDTLRGTTAVGPVREKLLGNFHVALAEAAGNCTLADLVRELVARSSLITMQYHFSNDPQCSCDEHETFLRLCH